MKLINSTLFLCGVLLTLTACKKEPPVVHGPGGLQGFAQSQIVVSITPETKQIETPVVYTKAQEAGRNTVLQFTIDPASTAQRAVQFEVPTATIENAYNLIFSAQVFRNKDGLGGTFPITFYPDQITEPVVLILNAVNSPDEKPVEGCHHQLTICLNPAQ